MHGAPRAANRHGIFRFTERNASISGTQPGRRARARSSMSSIPGLCATEEKGFLIRTDARLIFVQGYRMPSWKVDNKIGVDASTHDVSPGVAHEVGQDDQESLCSIT